MASLLLSGKPDTAIAALAKLAADKLRTKLHVDEILRHLAQAHCIYPKDLARDDRLLQQVEGANERFASSIRSNLAGDGLLARAETQVILEKLAAKDAKPILIMHGKAGAGKSGVLYELTKRLGERGTPYLALRLDRQDLGPTPEALGQNFGLPESPARCLRALAVGRPAILILDQLDAVRWTAAHASQAWEVCRQVIDQARAAQNLTVVVGCRTFDLKNDQQIKKWSAGQIAEQVMIAELSEGDVRSFLARFGVNYNDLTGRERELLHSIDNLSLWHRIRESKGQNPRFRTSADLMKEFWNTRDEEWRGRGQDSRVLKDVLDRVVESMERQGRLWAPQSLVSGIGIDVHALQSLGIFQIADGRVAFCHQSYFDYLVASALLKRLHEAQTDIPQWLGDKSRQSLFRREQLRQMLTLLREEDSVLLVGAVKSVLVSDSVRFHIKHLVLEVMGQLDSPSAAEIQLVSELLDQERWRKHVLQQVLAGNATWIEAVHARGILADWLASDKIEMINEGLWMIRGIRDTNPQVVFDLISPYSDERGEWPQRCLSVLPFDPCTDTDQLFELRMKMVMNNLGGQDV